MSATLHKPLSGQVALISGGLGDIGKAIASELAAQGAKVALCDLGPKAKAANLLKALKKEGQEARYHRVDVSDAEAVRQWVAAVETDLGLPSLIIPNAATVTPADTRTVTPAQWDREIRVNLNGAFYMAQAGTHRLLACKQPGRVVFVGSWAAAAVHTHIPAYCAAKAGLRMVCRCMALELAPYDILVNEVAPGYVDAGLSADLFRRQPTLRDAATRSVPTGRLISAEEVAQQVAFLCHPATRHLTGSVLLMDGGLSLHSAAEDRS